MRNLVGQTCFAEKQRPAKALVVELTERVEVRLRCGTGAITLRGRAELLRVAFQCWDLATVLADREREAAKDEC